MHGLFRTSDQIKKLKLGFWLSMISFDLSAAIAITSLHALVMQKAFDHSYKPWVKKGVEDYNNSKLDKERFRDGAYHPENVLLTPYLLLLNMFQCGYFSYYYEAAKKSPGKLMLFYTLGFNALIFFLFGFSAADFGKDSGYYNGYCSQSGQDPCSGKVNDPYQSEDKSLSIFLPLGISSAILAAITLPLVILFKKKINAAKLTEEENGILLRVYQPGRENFQYYYSPN